MNSPHLAALIAIGLASGTIRLCLVSYHLAGLRHGHQARGARGSAGAARHQLLDDRLRKGLRSKNRPTATISEPDRPWSKIAATRLSPAGTRVSCHTPIPPSAEFNVERFDKSLLILVGVGDKHGGRFSLVTHSGSRTSLGSYRVRVGPFPKLRALFAPSQSKSSRISCSFWRERVGGSP
jgi:hypothetical protein